MTVRSALGQPLEAEIALTSLSAREFDSLIVRLAPTAVFSDAGIDYTPLLRSLHLAVEKRGSGQVVRVWSDLPVSDPFIRLLVELNTNGSLIIREYTVLIDPPVLDAAENKVAQVPAAPATEATIPQPAAGRPLPGIAGRTASARLTNDARPTATRIVRRGETLRAIAAELQPENVQIEQVLIALQSSNPGAFVDGNINRLRQGSVLQIPATDVLRAIDAVEARRTLRIQNDQFARIQQQLAQRVKKSVLPATPSAASAGGNSNRTSRGQVRVSPATPSPSTAPEHDRLTLSAPGTGDGTGSAHAADTVDKVAAEKAIADANARIAVLEKNINQLQQLLEVRNGRMADAQQRAAQSGTGSPPDSALAIPARPAAPLNALVITPGSSPHSGTDSASSKPADAAAADATSPDASSEGSPASRVPEADRTPAQPATTPAGRPAPKTAPSLSSSSTPASVSDSMAQLLTDPPAVAAVIAALLLTTWGALRWRRRARVDKQVVEPVLADRGVIAHADGRHVDTRHSEFHSNFVPSVSQIHANEVDAVAEADVYIAYGRDEQAEEILLDALRIHPQRDALRVKLLEIYVARNDRQKFGALAAELRVLTHGVGADWEKAAQLGRLFDPGNRLFDTTTESSRSDSAGSDATPAAAPSVVEDFELRLDGLLEKHREAHSASTPAWPMQEPATANGIDFRLSGIDAANPLPAAAAGGPMDTEALNTKLELALACQEFGDRDGARELLGEVAISGHPELAQRAQSLLSQLA